MAVEIGKEIGVVVGVSKLVIFSFVPLVKITENDGGDGVDDDETFNDVEETGAECTIEYVDQEVISASTSQSKHNC